MFIRFAQALSLAGLLSAVPAMAVTQNDFSPGGTPFVGTSNNGGATPVILPGGPSGSFLQVMPDGPGGLDNRVGFNTTDITGARTITFDFRLPVEATHTGCCGQRADGFSVNLLDPAVHGNSGAGPNMPERPSNGGALGIGFDIFEGNIADTVFTINHNGTNFANVTSSAVNMTNGVFNRAQITLNPTVGGGTLVSMSITPDIFGAPGAPVSIFNNVLAANASVGGRLAFGGRTGGAVTGLDVDNVVANYDQSKATTATFDVASTGYTAVQRGGGPAAGVVGGGPTGSFLRMLHDAGGQFNTVAFDATQDTLNPGKVVHADFDFRVTNGTGGGFADGFSMLLIPTASNGGVGGGLGGFTAEEPNIAGVIAVGFDVFPGENDASLHFGSEIVNVNLNPSALNLGAGVFHHAKLVLEEIGGQVLATLLLTPDSLGAPGATIAAFSDVVIPGLTDLYSYRVEFAGRTGGETLILDIDNVNVRNFAIPEPATAALGLMALAGLGMRRRRIA